MTEMPHQECNTSLLHMDYKNTNIEPSDGTVKEQSFGGENYYNNSYNNHRGGSAGRFEEKPNHILLITVMNPAYLITTDVIHSICSQSGKVVRIVIFKKNGVQAMVEFESLEGAERAKQSLNGCDIYPGCCTLKIEFAKPTKLNVYKNDNESWDYTKNTFGKSARSYRPALLQDPPRGYGPGGYAPPYTMPHRKYSTSLLHMDYKKAKVEPSDGTVKDQSFGGGNFNSYNNRSGGSGHAEFEEKPNHVLLLTVMNPAYVITTDVIYTICSPSGKVLRIVIFKKNGVQAMVEFDSVEAAERAKQSLNGCDIYSGYCTLKIEFAKTTRLNVYKNDYRMSWDYTNNRLGKSGDSDRPPLIKEPPQGYGPAGNACPYGVGSTVSSPFALPMYNGQPYGSSVVTSESENAPQRTGNSELTSDIPAYTGPFTSEIGQQALL